MPAARAGSSALIGTRRHAISPGPFCRFPILQGPSPQACEVRPRPAATGTNATASGAGCTAAQACRPRPGQERRYRARAQVRGPRGRRARQPARRRHPCKGCRTRTPAQAGGLRGRRRDGTARGAAWRVGGGASAAVGVDPADMRLRVPRGDKQRAEMPCRAQDLRIDRAPTRAVPRRGPGMGCLHPGRGDQPEDRAGGMPVPVRDMRPRGRAQVADCLMAVLRGQRQQQRKLRVVGKSPRVETDRQIAAEVIGRDPSSCPVSGHPPRQSRPEAARPGRRGCHRGPAARPAASPSR
ncbi:MAG: hypothetical protein HLUCCA08_15520 [Rhodobacteraceae bacterium HLUCCA08]|nr:MAG: hypothetical protein HLUCCA08_15520 [Rhodobacteraceae bacterium HLUCCA08]